MAACIVDIPDDLLVYLQNHATDRGVPVSVVLEEMITEDLQLSHECGIAIQEAGVDVTDSEEPVLDAMRMVLSGLRYQKSVADALKKDAFSLHTLRKIDALRGNRSRDGFLCDLLGVA
ncbi:hypothetical protein M0R72_11120 [Candidatus Pacearchaeota archaeon]|jgi:hypothetical protein|nr:hypothetical protein [Candidatus Pacearchaeota archaeon]